MTRMIAAVAAGLFLATIGPAIQAQTPAAQAPAAQAPADALTDPAMKREEVIAFIGVKPGDHVADIIAGRFIRALSAAVGPKGKVYAVQADEIVKAHPEVPPALKRITDQPAYANVEVIVAPINALGLPGKLDAVFIRQNYHDLHDKFMGPADVPAFNRAVFAALKPGGAYVIADHAGRPGTGISESTTLHRIEEAFLRSEIESAGFRLVDSGTFLRNPADPRDKETPDPPMPKDEFILKFIKPL